MDSFDPKTKPEFERALDIVIRRAYENGVAINDVGMELRHTSSEIPDWELMIYQLCPSDSPHA